MRRQRWMTTNSRRWASGVEVLASRRATEAGPERVGRGRDHGRRPFALGVRDERHPLAGGRGQRRRQLLGPQGRQVRAQRHQPQRRVAPVHLGSGQAQGLVEVVGRPVGNHVHPEVGEAAGQRDVVGHHQHPLDAGGRQGCADRPEIGAGVAGCRDRVPRPLVGGQENDAGHHEC